MNTTGNRNRDLGEPISFVQHCVIGLLRLLIQPHVDNEQAADYLRTTIGQNNSSIQWAVVRPDQLTNEEKLTTYKLHPSPTRSAIFNAGKTNRINVSHHHGRFDNKRRGMDSLEGPNTSDLQREPQRRAGIDFTSNQPTLYL